jgi:hypothetical protein
VAEKFILDEHEEYRRQESVDRMKTGRMEERRQNSVVRRQNENRKNGSME